MEVHLIFLKPYIYLNQNVYAGINSVLGNYQKARLNSLTAIPSVVGIGADNMHYEAVTKKEAEKT